MKKIILFPLALFCLFSAFVLSPAIKKAIAATDWTLYVSETELFSALMPGNPDENVTTFRIGDGVLLHNSEVLSFIDQRPYKDVVKNYVIKLDQTFGPGISEDYRQKIVQRELDLYKKSYQDRNAQILDEKIERIDRKVTTGFLSLSYEDFEQGLQAVSVKVIISESSKLHQLFSGPAKNLDSIQVEQYFQSLTGETGVATKPGNMNEEWRRIESPLGLFAVKIPPVTPPYFNNEPSVKKEGKTERIGMVFTDPVWAQNLYYNVTGYQLENEMSFELAKTALLEKHLKKHGRNEVGITFHKDFIGETPYIETNYAIRPPKGVPYLNKVRLRAFFLGNYMIVQEVAGPHHLVETDFVNSFFDLVEFTPKKAFQKELQRHLNAAGGRPARAKLAE